MLDQMISTEVKNKQEKYDVLLPQIESLINKQNDVTTNLFNVLKVLRQHMGVSWAGFYHIGEEEFILEVQHGAKKCDRILLDEGACGLAYLEERSVVVDDIEQFAGHVSCEEDYKSEIVLPLFKRGEVTLLFNAKSNQLEYFSKADVRNLAIVMHLIEAIL
jgi:GAF domain-containing protein